MKRILLYGCTLAGTIIVLNIMQVQPPQKVRVVIESRAMFVNFEIYYSQVPQSPDTSFIKDEILEIKKIDDGFMIVTKSKRNEIQLPRDKTINRITISAVSKDKMSFWTLYSWRRQSLWKAVFSRLF